MDAGRKAYEKGQYDKAIREYQKVIKEDPKDVRVLLKIGDLYAKKNAKPEAISMYMQVAVQYSEQGFYLKAIAVYRRILQVDPRMVEVNLKLAELNRKLGLLSEAMQHFNMVAAFFHREGKTKEALATLRQLSDLDPDNVATRIKLAELYSKEGMTQEAIAEFKVTCEFLRKNGRQDDFIRVAERLFFHDNENSDLCRELATLYLKKNDPNRALAKLQICFKANQSDPAVLALLAQAFQRLDQKGKTVSVLKELAKVHTKANKRKEAAEVHEKILLYVPNDADSLTFLGRSGSQQTNERPDSVLEFNVNDVVPNVPRSKTNSGRMTGSMPLIQDPTATEFSVPRGKTDFGASRMVAQSEQPANGRNPVRQSRQQVAEDFVSDLEIEEKSGVDLYGDRRDAQGHADEIVKILTETDVYVKYKLNHKAIDHLRRVFTLDERNIEARDRLQAILLKEGRTKEGMDELMILAEHSVAQSPEKAEAYLRKIMSLDGSFQPAHAFAAKHRLNLGAGSVVGDDPAGHLAIADDGELDFEEMGFEDISAEEVGSEDLDLEYDFEDSDQGTDSANVAPTASYNRFEAGLADDELDFALDAGAGLSPTFSSPETTATATDTLPAAVPEFPNQSASYEFSEYQEIEELDGEFVEELDSVDIEAIEMPDDVQLDDVAELADMDDPTQTSPPSFSLPGLDPIPQNSDAENEFAEQSLSEPILPPPMQVHTPAPLAGPTTSSLEDDLEEADFFLSQGMQDEARNILDALARKHPNHPLVLTKIGELEESHSTTSIGGYPHDAGLSGPGVDDVLDALGDFDDSMLDDSLLDGVLISETSEPHVVLENPIDDNDADTHFDLGLAYREMGLHGEAIKAFEKVMQSPNREVECRLMVGLCHREQGTLSEAISQFKAGLYVKTISDDEKFSMYYEIGVTYELLKDPQEALYYYEMVLKKEANYRDVNTRISAIKSDVSRAAR